MDLKPELIQTEVGLIPEDWSVALLPDVCRFRSGKAHEQFVSEFGQYICVNSKFISTDGRIRKYLSKNFCPATKDDILLVMSDLPNGKALAKAFFVDRNNLYAVNQRVCCLTPYRDFPKYLFYYLNRNPYFLNFDDGVSQTHLLNAVFEKCPIALPPTRIEQEAIAEALTDIDSYIESLEQLLSKQRDNKQGVMQELLSGRRRLPGFQSKATFKDTECGRVSEDWEDRSVASFGEVVTGSTPSTSNAQYWNGTIPWITPTDISTRRDILSGERGITSQAMLLARRLPPGSVLVTCIASIGKNAILQVPGACNQQINAVIPNASTDSRFLYYMFEANKALMLRNAGTTATSIISKGVFLSLTFSVPATRAEQVAIATVLSDIDLEVTQLEDKVAKARDVKQGMMQQLLTGKIRLL